MTEELEKEAKEYADWFWGASPSMMRALAEAYIKGAEPREKRITALEQENTELKNHHENVCKNLTDTHRNIREQLAHAVIIIKNLLHLWEDVMTEDTVKAMIAEAKQFLKDTAE